MKELNVFLLTGIFLVGLLTFIAISNPVVYMGGGEVEVSNRAVTTISFPHDKVHTGDHYFKRDYFVLPNGGDASFSMYCENAPFGVHMIIEVLNEVEAEFILYENVTITTNGTELNYSNRNRYYGDDNCIELRHDPVYTGGNILARNRLGSGKSFGGTSRDTNEIILKPGVNYVLFARNLASGATNNINYLFDWYE